ncbi:hypothetical protein ABE583_01840 [Stenotrophomonas sp. TWI143]|uniref:hypothetical protein n=1 Tax=Stenotrophomonas sp. TWI143 TaxID=3136771 RepID=UPI00320A6651
MRLLAALSCLFTGVCIAAPHTPEQEYTLQARVVLQHDPAARDQLALWDAAAVPRNGIDWQRSLDDLPTWLRQQQIVPPSAAEMQDVTDALLARLSTATCAEAFLPLGSPEIGRFTLACALPDPAPTFALYRALRQAGPGGRRSTAMCSSAPTPSTFAVRRRHCIAPMWWGGPLIAMATCMRHVQTSCTRPFC